MNSSCYCCTVKASESQTLIWFPHEMQRLHEQRRREKQVEAALNLKRCGSFPFSETKAATAK